MRQALSLLLLFFCTQLYSQETESQESLAERIKWWKVVPGTIIEEDGNKITGYIRLTSAVSFNVTGALSPEQFQGTIRFMEKSIFENAPKIKLKNFIKIEPGDIQGYTVNNDSLIFESVTYADNSAVGLGMIPKKMFLRVVQKGKIDLFQHFDAFDPEANASIPGLLYVYRKGRDAKLRLVERLNIKNELSDCSYVVQKHQNKEYERGTLEQIRLRAIADYNRMCP
jgi:hypothetical protein